MKLSINAKLLFYILFSSTVIFTLVLLFVSFKSKQLSYSISTSIADNYAQQYAEKSKGNLEFFMNSTRSLGKVFENYQAIPDTLRRDVLSNMMRKSLEENDEFLSVWSILEPSSIDNLDSVYKNKPGSTVLGNFRYVFYKEEGQILLSQYVEQDPEEVLSGTVYNQLKSDRTESIINPYLYSYTGNKQDEIFETNMVVPIIDDTKFIGVLGVDVPLGTLQKMIDKIKPFENSYAFLVANNGEFVTHPDKKLIGKTLLKLYDEEEQEFGLIEKINTATPFSFTKTDTEDNEHYVSIAPFSVGKTTTPWAIGIVVPVDIIMQQANKNFLVSIIIGFIGIAFLSIIILIFARRISRPIIRVTNTLETLAQGDIFNTQKIGLYTKDDIGNIEEAVDNLIEGLTRTNEFAIEIGQGNFDVKFDLLGEDDNLGKSLIDMRENLNLAKQEEEKKQKEDEAQSWITQGLTRLGDILRKNIQDIEILSLNILVFLLDYIDAQQGVMYLINDNDSNNITYDRVAYSGYIENTKLQESYKIGEGYIGQCAFERKNIYLAEVPKDYVKIRSGLGESFPGSIMIFPLLLNEDLLGIIELDSFKKLTDYQLEFISKISDTIASTINGVRINIKTTQLLEQSQQQSEELAAQEEEMRQNMEEMQATQEESSAREFKFNSLFSSIKTAVAYAEFDMEGKCMNANENYCQLVNQTSEELIEEYLWNIGNLNDVAKNDIQNDWEDLRTQKSIKIIKEVAINDFPVQLIENFSAVTDSDGIPTRFISILVQNSEY